MTYNLDAKSIMFLDRGRYAKQATINLNIELVLLNKCVQKLNGIDPLSNAVKVVQIQRLYEIVNF